MLKALGGQAQARGPPEGRQRPVVVQKEGREEIFAAHVSGEVVPIVHAYTQQTTKVSIKLDEL